MYQPTVESAPTYRVFIARWSHLTSPVHLLYDCYAQVLTKQNLNYLPFISHDCCLYVKQACQTRGRRAACLIYLHEACGLLAVSEFDMLAVKQYVPFFFFFLIFLYRVHQQWISLWVIKGSFGSDIIQHFHSEITHWTQCKNCGGESMTAGIVVKRI